MWAVVIAGGSGTRLWPLSRELYPKHLINLGTGKHSLLQETINRVLGIVPVQQIIIVTLRKQETDIKRQLQEIGAEKAILLQEPLARNTAPAIGLAAYYIYQKAGSSAVMAVLPADHLISPQAEFAFLLTQAQQLATRYGKITFGIKPTYPETGYGYIYCGQELTQGLFQVAKFVEKPELALAKKFLLDEHFLWNSGMFVFKTGSLLEAYEQYLPHLSALLSKIDYEYFTNLPEIYTSLENVSIDFGIMEKTRELAVMPTTITWSDMGNWEALYQVSPKDETGNCLHGRVTKINTKNCFLYSSSRLLSTIGVENLIVVDTKDALLICSRKQAQQVKFLVEKLKKYQATEAILHPTIYRPWGCFSVLEEQGQYKIKKIIVNPNCRLSLQSHHYHSEHWLIVKGEAIVTINSNEKLLQEGETAFIPVDSRHRITNPGDKNLELIEVQRGNHIDEKDITRYEDDYERIKPPDPFSLYNDWLEASTVDAQTKQELQQIKTDQAAITERFGAELSFGTGGLRGIIGAGLNRMNIYVVRKATQGLADYLNLQTHTHNIFPLKVAIAYDTRLYSKEFAEAAALVLAANGIKAYLSDGPRPTPYLSYSIKELGCAAGIVVTASHNPPQYNGYKVYGADGAQAVSSMSDDLTYTISKVDIFQDVRTITRAEAEAKDLLELISPDIDRQYIQQVKALSLSQPQQKIKVVFTPLHGTGSCFIPLLLRQTDFVELQVVKEQMLPDSSFSTVKVPNPEDKATFALALELCKKDPADLIIASDPDCDRLGCAIKDEKGNYHFLTGNQIGALLLEYLLSRLQAHGKLPVNGVMIKTIVTSDLGKKVAAAYGIPTIETLTGFKYIGEKIKEFETNHTYRFLFGYEESYGYLADTFARDKDANIAAFLLAEMAAYYQEQGQNLVQVLESLFQRHGYFREDLLSVGVQDNQAMVKIMTALDLNPPAVPGIKAVEKRDYQKGKSRNLMTGEEETLTLPSSKVLYYRFDDDSWFCFRPSGTEPKVKFYFSVVAPSKPEAEKKLAQLKKAVLALTE